MQDSTQTPSDFIRNIIKEDLKNKKISHIVTRFPPEPNGYLHIGHAKSICLNFALAQEFKGRCHLRFDDTDPIKEEEEFVQSIQEAIKWLGFDWGKHLYHTSSYFETLYEYAQKLIKMEKAYVCSLSLEDIRRTRGTVTRDGENSPYRNRSKEENLELFKKMRSGEFEEGSHVLRAKIDMTSSNMQMRDPVLYRIKHAQHHRTQNQWCIYPMYDFAHCLSDSIENVTHSICTLEFENNRELYDWIINTLDTPCKPRQYEFARLNLNYTVMSKRLIQQLVEEKHVNGWDDPRLPTLAGLRRRGYTPQSIRQFCRSCGIAKANSTVDMAQLEHSIRNDLNHRAKRILVVLDPLKVTITNYPEEKTQHIQAPYFPQDVPKEKYRPLPFSREIYIERSDFMENPPKGYFRLAPGQEVRLRHSVIIRFEELIKDEKGNILELKCQYDTNTPPGKTPADGRKIKGTIQWVSKKHAIHAKVRIYDRLFTCESPTPENFLSHLNPKSFLVYENALAEESLKNTPTEEHFQFERLGYFVTDRKDSKPHALVFNQTVSLKDSWSKQQDARKKKVKNHEGEEKALNYHRIHHIPLDLARQITSHNRLCPYFEEVVKYYQGQVETVAKWLLGDVLRLMQKRNDPSPSLAPHHLAELLKSIDNEVISIKNAKKVLHQAMESQKSPLEIIDELGFEQISDPASIQKLLEGVKKDHEQFFNKGHSTQKVKGFLTGQVMRASEGKANPKVLKELIEIFLQG